jgi:hypothetical protein
MTTGDGWTTTMHDTIHDMGLFCSIYWILFVCINVHIVLNIVIAVIFDKIEEDTNSRKPTETGAYYTGAVDEFQRIWMKYDNDATGFIKTK